MQPEVRYSVGMAHALVVEGDRESALRALRTHAAEELSIVGEPHADFVVFEYGLFSVDDARAVAQFASSAPVAGDTKMVVIAATRIFHEAQNALLKLFEEPPASAVMALCVPSVGQLLPTLRSRVVVLSSEGSSASPARELIKLTPEAREKFLGKLLDRTKADKDEDKQAARGELLTLVEDLIRETYQAREKASDKDKESLTAFLADLSAFLPILHERSAPLKLIVEHVLLVFPRALA
jgi:hypothetical protein